MRKLMLVLTVALIMLFVAAWNSNASAADDVETFEKVLNDCKKNETLAARVKCAENTIDKVRYTDGLEALMHTIIGQFYYECGLYDLAIDEFTFMSELASDMSKQAFEKFLLDMAYNQRADAYIKACQYDDAMDDIKKIFELKTFSYRVPFGSRGILNQHFGNNEQAIRDFKSDLKMKPSYKSNLNLTKAYIAFGEADNAAGQITNTVAAAAAEAEKEPPTDEMSFELAALQFFSDWFESNPGTIPDFDATLEKAEASLEDGRKDSALPYYLALHFMDPANSEISYKAAELFDELGLLTQAMDYYNLTRCIDPENDNEDDIEERIEEIQEERSCTLEK